MSPGRSPRRKQSPWFGLWRRRRRVSNQRSRRDRPRLRGEEYAALDLGHLNRLGNRRDRQARHARQRPRRDYRDDAAWYRRFHRCNVAWPRGRTVSGRAIGGVYHVGGGSGVAPCTLPHNGQATLTLEFRRVPLSLADLRTSEQNRHRGESHLSAPATPPDRRVRIRRFDRFIPTNKLERGARGLGT